MDSDGRTRARLGSSRTLRPLAGASTTRRRVPVPQPLSDTFDYPANLIACANGNRQALQQLYEQEGARLLGVAKRIVRDHAIAEDIVHDAFLNIWTRANTFDPARGSARGWIYSITRHLALNFVRGQAKDVQPSAANAQTIEAALSADSPYDETDALVHAGQLDGCLSQLEAIRRECIVHAYVDGYSHAEISAKLGAPLGTVKAWIKRSLVALRECMK
ncbi:sigma-70 family RNA polymerase sigma factor [Pseudomonas sp. PDM14]|uniref:sigma-70 family RNA polymerase sigma factor n=1 Tax=Pseudomonas sp. PDM14 TaxID=2769288 RepID=UPI001786D301|nr:sigma-70 family RNA polymerase sigma factor [Pseudomonas sp. PDM14]MBD9482566.1 sigma-70 family RNA polymerase sigma factor [Pseudomonas sp. PDM14]